MKREVYKKRIPWNKGKIGVYSKDIRLRISQSLKGRKLTEEHKRKIGFASKGRKHTIESRKKISFAKKGKPQTAKQVEINRLSHLGQAAWNKGKKLSLESREKMKLGQLNRKLNYGYINSPQARKKRLEAISQRGSFKETSIEFKVYNELKRTGFLFEKQKLINGKFLVDAFIPSLNFVIEADGCYWHKCEKCGYNGRKLDKSRNAYLTACGYKIVRIPEHEIVKEDFNISKFIEARQI